MEEAIIQTKKTSLPVTKYKKTYQDLKSKEIKQEAAWETDEFRTQIEDQNNTQGNKLIGKNKT